MKKYSAENFKKRTNWKFFVRKFFEHNLKFHENIAKNCLHDGSYECKAHLNYVAYVRINIHFFQNTLYKFQLIYLFVIKYFFELSD